MMTNRKNGTLYIGVTSDLSRRAEEHRQGLGSEFTAKYGLNRLVWFDKFERVTAAITREKTMKKWPRQWKINLIEENNPNWHDLRGQLH